MVKEFIKGKYYINLSYNVGRILQAEGDNKSLINKYREATPLEIIEHEKNGTKVFHKEPNQWFLDNKESIEKELIEKLGNYK